MTLKERFRQIKKLPIWMYWLPFKLMQFLHLVMRTEIIDPHHYIESYTADPSKLAVTVTWHNRLLFFPVMFKRKTRERTVAVISASRDGQYISDLVSMFGIKSVRGSTSRQAVQVLHNAFKTMKNGSLISFTPDGPRGPCYHMSKGPIHLASMMQVPIIPIAVNYSHYWSLRSWDRFQIPKPWSKLTLVLGDEIFIPADLTPETMEEWRKKVEDALNAITHDIPSEHKKDGGSGEPAA